MYRNIIKVFSLDFLAKVFLGFLTLLLIRFMPPDEYALFTFAMAIAAILMQVISGAFNRVYIVSAASLGIKERDFSLFLLQLIVISCIAIIGLFFSPFSVFMHSAILIYVLAISGLDYIRTIYQKELNFNRFALIEVVRAFLCLIIVLLIIKAKNNQITALQTIWILAITIGTAFLIVADKLFKETISFLKAIEIGRQILKGKYVSLFFYFVIIAVLGQVDIFMLKKMSDELSLASYGSAARYYGLIMLTLTAVHSVLLPYIEKAKTSDELYKIVRDTNKFLLFIMPIVLLAIALAGWLIPLVDNGKYPEAIPIFRILAVSSIISFALSPYVNIVMRFEAFQWLCFYGGVFLLVAVLLNVMLIPHLKAIGTAIATLCSFGGFNFLTMLKARELIKANS